MDTLPIVARIRIANLLVKESPALLVHMAGEVLIMWEMSESTVNVFRNKDLLTDVGLAENGEILTVLTNGGSQVSIMIGLAPVCNWSPHYISSCTKSSVLLACFTFPPQIPSRPI
jgi:hypothetical protein